MKRPLAVLFALALLSLLSLPPVLAQTTVETKHQGPFNYDVTQEVAIGGTLFDVLAKPTAGMIAGSRLLFTTPSGPVDFIFGRYALLSKGALVIVTSRQVEVAGVWKTNNDKFQV
jgi:hypothetical protein